MSTQIDLKQTRFFVRDGYSNAGSVNNASGYPANTTTMLLSGVVGVIPAGATFFVGTTDHVSYEVISQTATNGNTTSVTFAPGLDLPTANGIPISFQPNQIEVRIGEGNMTYDEKRPRKYRLNRGLIDSVKDDDQAPLEVTMDFVWDHIISQNLTDPPTIEEALKRIGNAANWVTSDPDQCQPYSVDLVILYTPDCATQGPESITLPKFRYDSLSHNVKDGTVAMKGSCNCVAPTVVRFPAAMAS